MPIFFNNEGINFKVNRPLVLKQWIKKVVAKEEKKLGEINFIFCNDTNQLQRNKQFLKHNTYTDIITFDYTEKNKISGDIFISVERVNDNSIKYAVSFDTEFKRVLIHGVLHLCGYKDKTKPEALIMRKKENEALKLIK